MKLALPLALLVLPLLAAAQHAPSPYAGQERRAIKSLSEKEVASLLAGEGMGYAKAAELNGYPGPAHVLELAEPLGLDARQRQATQELMARHRERARQLGRELVAAEERLDRAFASRSIDERTLAELTAEVGRRQAAVREEHLRTHLTQTALLSPTQVQRYQQLRGYAAGAAPAARHGSHSHGGHHR